MLFRVPFRVPFSKRKIGSGRPYKILRSKVQNYFIHAANSTIKAIFLDNARNNAPNKRAYDDKNKTNKLQINSKPKIFCFFDVFDVYDVYDVYDVFHYLFDTSYTISAVPDLR